MGLRINHNVSAVNAHRNLLHNDMRLSKSLEKLSSGLKINRASDGPASLVISEQMRSQVKGLDQAIKNSEISISMIQTAESALNEVNTLLVNMRQLAIHAANEGANDEVMLQADQQEIENSMSTIDRIASNTQFGTKKLLDGSNGVNGTASGKGLEFVSGEINTKASENQGYEVIVTRQAKQASLTGTAEMTNEIIEAGETLTLTEGGKTVSYTTNELDTVQTAVQNFASAARKSGLDVSIDLTEDNRISITHNKYGSDYTFQAASTTEGILSDGPGQLKAASAGQDLAGTINGELAIGKGQTMTGVTGNATTEGLQVRFRGQLEDVPEEGTQVGYVNVTQNALTFQVGANRNQTVGVALRNTAADQLARGINTNSDFKSLSAIDVTSSQGAQDSIMVLDAAINEVSQMRADLGTFQKNTLESNLSNLRTASENLIAAESSIRDTDMAAEVAEYTRNKIMMNSATAMLSQANAVPNTIMALLAE
jgi:flagellin